MSILVSKSSPVLVGPAIPPQGANTMDLSSIDQSLAGYSITSFLVYEAPIHKPAESIQRALSQTLVQYHSIAGRLFQATNGKELTISCTNEGVQYVAARANCSLAEIKLVDSALKTELIKDLATIHSPDGRYRHTDPLLSMQVTEFSCGGFVIGTTSNHVIADGEGMAQFLQAIGELARGFSQPSITPIRSANSLATDSPLLASSNKWLMTLCPVGMAYLDITFPSTLINRIKSKFDDQCNIKHCTLFEAAVAMLWQCRTRAVMTDPDTPMPLLFASSIRKHVGAKDGYYGNCFTMQAVVATSGEVANSHINDVVRLIKGAKEKVSEMSNTGTAISPVKVAATYNVFLVSSWRNIGLDAVDFGSGRPARVIWPGNQRSVPSSVLCPPIKDKDGANISTRCVKKEHVGAFLEELAKFK